MKITQLNKAMIFAAGLGTRLYPLTENKPKALVEINNKTLLEIAINKLKKSGIKDIIINVHHFADKIIEFLNSRNNFGISIIISDERDLLLDTGGGLKKASWFFADGNPFLVYNVDIISNIDLNNFYQFHIQSGALASLAVRNRPTSRYFLFDNQNVLCGWKNVKTYEEIIAKNCGGELIPLAFSGIQIVSPKMFSIMPAENKFSMIDLYLKAASQNYIIAYPHDNSSWFDVGNKNNLLDAEKYLNNNTD